jgi:hypothetical protein
LPPKRRNQIGRGAEVSICIFFRARKKNRWAAAVVLSPRILFYPKRPALWTLEKSPPSR